MERELDSQKKYESMRPRLAPNQRLPIHGKAMNFKALGGPRAQKKRQGASPRKAERRNSRPEGSEAHLEQSRPRPGLFFEDQIIFNSRI